MNPSKKVRINHYKDFCLLYGLNTVLMTLQYFEEIEDYEECYCIFKGVELYKKESNTSYKEWSEKDKKRPPNKKQCEDLINYFNK